MTWADQWTVSHQKRNTIQEALSDFLAWYFTVHIIQNAALNLGIVHEKVDNGKIDDDLTNERGEEDMACRI